MKTRRHRQIHKRRRSRRISRRGGDQKGGSALRGGYQKGGDPSNKKWLPLRTYLLTHSDISRLGPDKPVATAHSGPEPRKLYNMWHELSPTDKDYLANHIWPKMPGFNLGVHTSDGPRNIVGNIIIFYSVQDLDILSEVVGKSVDEILEIISKRNKTNTYEGKINQDIITIAFNDPSYELETPEGQVMNELYQAAKRKTV